MITICGEDLSKDDRILTKKFCRFVLDKFVEPEKQKKVHISIKAVDEKDEKLTKEQQKDVKEYKAICYNEQRKRFLLLINRNQIKNHKKGVLGRLKEFLLCVGHELMHVKQYLNGELKDLNDVVLYKGKKYSYESDENPEIYWFSPWEIEAYGHELALYAVFKYKVKKGEI